ncbi:MAG: protein translocase subunit SecF [Bacillota bacterium]|jgi:preprotein translocase subunit SecF
MLFNLIKARKIGYIISTLVIIPGLISLMFQGLNLGIDFTGGNLLEVKFDRPVAVQEVRQVMAEHGVDSSRGIQQVGDDNFIIRTQVLDDAESAKLLKSMDEQIGGMTLLRNDFVGPVIGKELTQRALLALLVASVLMVIYISVRFEFKQGIAAIVALLHDVLVVLGIFSIFQLEVDSAFVAAMLTIIGYSINDTIIIFDRIRENLRPRSKMTLEDLVNVSIWQTLTRSINTGVTVLLVLVAMYFLGGVTIKYFVLAMIIGVISGTYSSIFNASPLWVDMKLREKKPRRLQPADAN